MEAKELRIGNLVTYNGKEISISPSGLSEYYYLSDTHAESKIDKRSYKPIPLTAEWLERFGFKNSSGTWYSKKFVTPVQDHPTELFVNVKSGSAYITDLENKETAYIGIKMSAVHILQNTYPVLSGEELTPKE